MRNYELPANAQSEKHKKRPKPPNPGAGPNDTNWPNQWNLGNMNWGQAWSTYAGQQTTAATIVILGSGCVTAGSELGPNITEYDAFKKKPVKIPVQGLVGDTEGDIDCSVPGAVTNNGQLISGAASFQSWLPCNIILMKVVKNGSPDSAAVMNAISWIVNNKSTINNGHGVPVSLSYDTQHFYTTPFWQKVGQSLLNANDILVMSAGDIKSTLRNEPTGTVAVIQATDYDNNLFLVSVKNDAMAAPGAIQPAIIDGKLNQLHDGSSFSAPLWTSCIGLLIAFNPNLSASQANQILVNTGTKVPNASWYCVIPNINAALNAAINQTPPIGTMPPTIPTQ